MLILYKLFKNGKKVHSSWSSTINENLEHIAIESILKHDLLYFVNSGTKADRLEIWAGGELLKIYQLKHSVRNSVHKITKIPIEIQKVT